MGSQISRANRSTSSRHPPPPLPAEPPARTFSNPNPNSNSNSDSQINPSDADMSSYEAACRSDPDLQSFDSSLQLRTSRAINSIAVGLEVRSLSLDSLSEVTECLLEMNQEVVKIFLQDKKDIWKNQELSDLVDDYFENSLLTMDFCTALDACLKRAGRIESIINVALRKFEEEHYSVTSEGSVKNYSRTLEELRNFKGASDPFTQEFFKIFSSIYSRQSLMLEKLQAKKRNLDKKLGKLKAWRKISMVIFVVTFASVLICSVVAAAVAAPPVVTALAAAAAVPLGSMGRWLNSLWKKCERDLRGQREIISSMQIGTYIVIKDLDNIRVLVDRFQIKIEDLLANADFAMSEDEAAVVTAVKEIREKADDFIKTIHDLSEHANKCTQETRMARTLILRRIINHPSGSNQDIGFSPPLMADFSSCPPESQTPKLGSYANVTASSSNRSNLPFDPKRVVPVGTHQVRDGKQVLGFSSSENDRLAASWKLTLIGKFSFAIPHPKGIDSGLSSLNLKGPYSWSFANPSHIIIKLQLEEDFNKLWMGTLWSLGDCPMRVFKWTPSFNPRMEAPLAPVWIRLPGLPIHFFDHNALFAISMIIGMPLQVDSLTASRSRLSMARVCVELDLLKERIEEIVLEFDDTSHAQKIIYERIPDYCTHCKHIGHSIEGCYMNGKITRPPPPVRRHTPIAGSAGYDLKGLSENMEKLKGTTDNSKISRAENPNPTRGAQRAAAQNHEWVMVKKKGPRETGLIPKELLKLAKNSKHTYFEDNHSNAGTNRFSSLENEDFQPLDTLPQLLNGPDQVNVLHADDQIDSINVDKNLLSDVAVARNEYMASVSNPNNLDDNLCLKDNLAEHACWNGQNGLENGVIIPSAVNESPKCLNHSIPTLSSFEINKHTPVLHLGVAHAFEETFKATKECQLGPPSLNSQMDDSSNLNSIPIGPQTLSDNLDIIGHNRPPALNLNMIEIVGDNLINGSDFKGELAVGVFKGVNCGASSENSPPVFSKSATLLEGFNGQFDNMGNLYGPTSTPFHAQKVENAQHILDFDKSKKNGLISLSSSRVVPSNVVGLDVFLSPFNNSATIAKLDPPHHFPSIATYTPCPPNAVSRATLGLHCRSNEAQHFSSIPAQLSSAAQGSEPNPMFTSPVCSANPSPIKSADQAHSAESSVPHLGHYFSILADGPLNGVQPIASLITSSPHSPVSDAPEVKEVGFADSCGPNQFDHPLHSNANNSILEDGKIATKLHKDNHDIGVDQTDKIKKFGVDKSLKPSKRSSKSGKLVHNFLYKGGGSQRTQNRSGVSKSSSHSNC